jgi:hypothetical protein
LHYNPKYALNSPNYSGSAGSISVSAPIIALDNSNISAKALEKSNGQTGHITVTATQDLQLNNQSKVSIENNATVLDNSAIKSSGITVSSPDIALKNSSVTAASSGNVDAGNITANVSHQLNMDSSEVTTSAKDGNGGGITINGGELINLQNSQFLTSVIGANGNGGNINVTANILVMNDAAIQANAIAGKGGDIGLNLNALIPSYDSLIKGGTQVSWQPFIPGFNVIQAASATGVSGNLNFISPQFNIAGVLAGFKPSDPPKPINRNPCQGKDGQLESTFGMDNAKGGTSITDAKQVYVSPIKIPKHAGKISNQHSHKRLDNFAILQHSKDQPCSFISI